MIWRQTRIFLPQAKPFNSDEWAENVLGYIIQPILSRMQPQLFWFSRYVATVEEDSHDCDISKIPQEFRRGDGRYWSLRFRYHLDERDMEAFERVAGECIQKAGGVVSDFRDYFCVGDLGSDRFLGGSGDKGEKRREERALRVASFVHETCRLFMDCLIGPDAEGNYHEELNAHFLNATGSTFQSVHHLFCNITDVPTCVYLPYKTHPDGRLKMGELKVRF